MPESANPYARILAAVAQSSRAPQVQAEAVDVFKKAGAGKALTMGEITLLMQASMAGCSEGITAYLKAGGSYPQQDIQTLAAPILKGALPLPHETFADGSVFGQNALKAEAINALAKAGKGQTLSRAEVAAVICAGAAQCPESYKALLQARSAVDNTAKQTQFADAAHGVTGSVPAAQAPQAVRRFRNAV